MVGDMSPFMRSPSEIVKFFSIFGNQMNQNINMDRAAYNRWRSGKLSGEDAAAFAFYRYVIPIVALSLLDQGFKPDEKDFLAAALKQPFGGAPVVGNVINSMMYNVDNFHRPASAMGISDIFFPRPLATAGASRGAGAIISATHALERGEPVTMKQAMDILAGISTTLGMPGDMLRGLGAAASDLSKNPSMNTAEFLRSLLFTPYQRRRGPLFGEAPSKKKSKKIQDPFGTTDPFEKMDRKLNRTADKLFMGDF